MQKPSAPDGAASPTQVQSRLLKGPSFADVVIQDAVLSAGARLACLARERDGSEEVARLAREVQAIQRDRDVPGMRPSQFVRISGRGALSVLRAKVVADVPT